MAALRWCLGSAVVVALAACGANSGASGVDAVATDTGDSQIAPEDSQDAAGTDTLTPDAVTPDALGDATDAVVYEIWIDSDVPPPDIAPDVVDTADTFTPANCVGMGGSGTCANGLICWTPPCPNCGVMPQGFCLPPLTGGACYDYTNCSNGDCHNATPTSGIAGWCLPIVKTAGQCWPNVSELIPDCYSDATCDGAVLCPPKAECLVADKPGSCTATAAQKGNVYLWERNGGIVSPGESVIVTWVNNTSASIFLPGCSTYSIQTSPDSTVWTDKGPAAVCVWEGVAVEVPAGSYVDTIAWQAPTDSVGNYRFHGTYSTGCTPGKAISQGGCTGSQNVNSSGFFVGYVP